MSWVETNVDDNITFSFNGSAPSRVEMVGRWSSNGSGDFWSEVARPIKFDIRNVIDHFDIRQEIGKW